MTSCGITGATGFIGSHLARALLDRGVELTALVRDTAHPALESLESSPHLHLVEGDVLDRETVVQVFTNVEVIFHLAASTAIFRAQQEPVADLAVNALGTAHVLEAARANGHKRVIFASAGAVYASQAGAREEDWGWPGHFYGTSKRVAEWYAGLYGIHFDVACTALRLARVYGPGARRGVVYDILSAYIEDRPIRLYTNRDSVFDLLYVDDAVRAFLSAWEDGWPAEPVNVSSGEGVVIGDLVHLLARRLGRSLPVEVANPERRCDVLNHNRARALGWWPMTSLNDGLDRTIAWFEQDYGRIL